MIRRDKSRRRAPRSGDEDGAAGSGPRCEARRGSRSPPQRLGSAATSSSVSDSRPKQDSVDHALVLQSQRCEQYAAA